MAWKKARDPLAPAEPAFHHPERCLNCGHLQQDHVAEVGCTANGGAKYIENEAGVGRRACSCEVFVPVEEGVLHAQSQI